MALVLVIEDRFEDRAVLMALLMHAGHAVAEALDGDEGLDLTRARRPDVVIADMLVPRLDGLDYAQAVRRDPEIAHTPIILYTAAYEAWELEKLASAAGISRVLEKPADPSEILDAIEETFTARGR